MIPSLTVAGVGKRFTIPNLPKNTSLKSHVVGGGFFQFDRKRRIVEALNDVTFTVRAGSMLGVIGRNGSGKTTLLRILAGIFAPDEGHVRIEGRIAPLLALGTGFHPDLTGRENAKVELLVLGIPRREIDRYIDEIITFSELGDFIDVPMRMYSSGMAMRLAFAAATSIDFDILLVDEALAVGDAAFTAKCLARTEGYLRAGKIIVFVTHNMAGVLKRCDTALWLDHGNVAAFGPAAEVVAAYR